jgi:hypothetical protein
MRSIWERSQVTRRLGSRLAFLLTSKLYRQMYANTGMATDSARVSRATTMARLLAKSARRLFVVKPMPELEVPQAKGFRASRVGPGARQSAGGAAADSVA